MITVQTILNEYQDTKTASSQILNQWPWREQLLPRLQCCPSIVWWMHCKSRQMKGSGFKYYNCHFQGLPRPEQCLSWRDLILQRVPSATVVTSPNRASPQAKHCNPPIPSHSRISHLVPPEYGGNLGRGKIGTQTPWQGVIFASPSVCLCHRDSKL